VRRAVFLVRMEKGRLQPSSAPAGSLGLSRSFQFSASRLDSNILVLNDLRRNVHNSLCGKRLQGCLPRSQLGKTNDRVAIKSLNISIPITYTSQLSLFKKWLPPSFTPWHGGTHFYLFFDWTTRGLRPTFY